MFWFMKFVSANREQIIFIMYFLCAKNVQKQINNMYNCVICIRNIKIEHDIINLFGLKEQYTVCCY